MLTAVIRVDGSRVGGSVEALAATFSVLIPAVADGFLGHAVVIDAAGRTDIERLADATGASYLRAGGAEGWHLGAAQARGDWLFLLESGDVPQPHWTQAVERHLIVAPDAPALIALRGVAGSLRERAAISFGPRRLRPGLIVPKGHVLAGRLGSAPRRLGVRRERAVAG
ncbi:MAG TPA: glycosyltransferase family A protein [Bosea sp. (in: a-proteobacteria)]|jgi:hypothetical protein|uniref:glycosyltransferase family A protein n=1 Tax=Bosea sp. (in: a-proteobacteria) TaxID=1871050 RepID=UPI002E1240A3|nr:glycosyltransferase family A protein [Bosea sp. (in: a-proteobacteria)]